MYPMISPIKTDWVVFCNQKDIPTDPVEQLNLLRHFTLANQKAGMDETEAKRRAAYYYKHILNQINYNRTTDRVVFSRIKERIRKLIDDPEIYKENRRALSLLLSLCEFKTFRITHDGSYCTALIRIYLTGEISIYINPMILDLHPDIQEKVDNFNNHGPNSLTSLESVIRWIGKNVEHGTVLFMHPEDDEIPIISDFSMISFQ